MRLSVIITSGKKELLTAASVKETCPCEYEIVVSRTFGLGKARNDGARRSKGKQLVFLDDDLILDKALWPRILSIKEGEFGMCFQWDRTPCSRVLALHKSDFWKVGGFDEQLKYNGEDRDFYGRMIVAGLRFTEIPMRLIRHVEHPRRCSNIHLSLKSCVDNVRVLMNSYRRLRLSHKEIAWVEFKQKFSNYNGKTLLVYWSAFIYLVARGILGKLKRKGVAASRILRVSGVKSLVAYYNYEKTLRYVASRIIGRKEMFKHTAEFVIKKGLILEFGVFQGETLQYLCDIFKGQIVYGFDSFKGMPEAWYDVPKDMFRSDVDVAFPENAEIVTGYFQDTLGTFLDNHEEDAAYVHIDCDTFSASYFVLDILCKRKRLTHGSVLQFDDFFNYPQWEKTGEYKAFTEIVKKYGLIVTPLAYTVTSKFSVFNKNARQMSFMVM